MYFATFHSSGEIQPQIIGLSSSVENIEKLIMAKLNNSASNKYSYIEDVPCSYTSIGHVENLDNKSNKPINTLEPYSRIKEDKLKPQEQNYEKENPKPEKDNNIPYVVRYVKHKHLQSYFLTFKQAHDLEEKFVYFNRIKERDINIVSIFETSSLYIDFIHILNIINETSYHDY